MNKTRAAAILKELQKRKLNQVNWEASSYLKQWNFINDPSSLKVAQCTRRAGKSYGAGLYAFKEAHSTPGVSVVIVGLTRDSIKKIYMKDIMRQINNDLKLGASPNRSDLTWTLPNGSIIYLVGVDANPDDMNKLLGQKNKLVIIDESAFYRQNMRKLVYEILIPTMIDYNGTIALISTTSHLTKTLYYDITMEKIKGWSVHKWTALDNPHIAEKWKKQIEALKINNPGIEQTPAFRRMYLNEWVIDEDSLVYRHQHAIHIDNLPDTKTEWHYVLGIDLGFEDDTAFVVCAYNEYDERLYVIETFNKSKMIISAVASKIDELNKKYKFSHMVVDNASKQAVEEMKVRYQLPLIPADKTDKRVFIEMLNSDLITKKICILPDAKPLTNEWTDLVFDERKLQLGKFVEHPAVPNHLSDAFLYAWRYVYSYTSKPKTKILPPSSEEAVDQWWEEEGDKLDQDAVPHWLKEDPVEELF
jgi:hypothetical protein